METDLSVEMNQTLMAAFRIKQARAVELSLNLTEATSSKTTSKTSWMYELYFNSVRLTSFVIVPKSSVSVACDDNAGWHPQADAGRCSRPLQLGKPYVRSIHKARATSRPITKQMCEDGCASGQSKCRLGVSCHPRYVPLCDFKGGWVFKRALIEVVSGLALAKTTNKEWYNLIIKVDLFQKWMISESNRTTKDDKNPELSVLKS